MLEIGSVKVGIDSDKIKVKLTESEIEKNAPWLSADVITFSSMNTTYSDEETFYMIQRYVGDFNTMIRFAKLPSFINSEKNTLLPPKFSVCRINLEILKQRFVRLILILWI